MSMMMVIGAAILSLGLVAAGEASAAIPNGSHIRLELRGTVHHHIAGPERDALAAAPSFAVQRVALHRRPWPICDGFNHQPSQNELRALHQRDVTPDEARELDRLYDQLLSSSETILRQQPALVH
jgi:hypothetical protein